MQKKLGSFLFNTSFNHKICIKYTFLMYFNMCRVKESYDLKDESTKTIRVGLQRPGARPCSLMSLMGYQRPVSRPVIQSVENGWWGFSKAWIRQISERHMNQATYRMNQEDILFSVAVPSSQHSEVCQQTGQSRCDGGAAAHGLPNPQSAIYKPQDTQLSR